MKKEIIYEGKAKKFFSSAKPNELIQHFKDDATAFNNKKKSIIPGKGIINNFISELIMTKLSQLNEKRLGLSVNLPCERTRDFSIRKTFNTRSPMISLLLPTPAERLEVSMMHYEHKKKMLLGEPTRQNPVSKVDFKLKKRFFF